MLLYLIRHTDAEDTQPDAQRRLSARGQKQARRLARFLRDSGAFTPEEFWQSALVRAQETAALLALGTRLSAPLREVAGLTPEDDPAVIARILVRGKRPIALVGHEPHLSALASLLVTGATEPVRFVMKKGATLALEGSGRQWLVRWQIEPDLLP